MVMTDNEEALMIFGVIAVVVLGVAITSWISTRRKTIRHLQSLATQLQLDFLPAPSWFKEPRVTGTRRGRTVQIFNYRTGSGKTTRTWSAVSAQPAGDGRLTFTIRQRNLTTRINHIFGPKPLTLGDPEFDKAWFVQTNQPEFLLNGLLPEVRARLMEARHAGAKGTFELDYAMVKYSESGCFTSHKCVGRFLAAAEAVCDLAELAEVAVKST